MVAVTAQGVTKCGNRAPTTLEMRLSRKMRHAKHVSYLIEAIRHQSNAPHRPDRVEPLLLLFVQIIIPVV